MDNLDLFINSVNAKQHNKNIDLIREHYNVSDNVINWLSLMNEAISRRDMGPDVLGKYRKSGLATDKRLSKKTGTDILGRRGDTEELSPIDHVKSPVEKARDERRLKELQRGSKLDIVVEPHAARTMNPDVLYSIDNNLTFLLVRGNFYFAHKNKLEAKNNLYDRLADYEQVRPQHRHLLRILARVGKLNYLLDDEDDMIEADTIQDIVAFSSKYNIVLGRYADGIISFWSYEDKSLIEKVVKKVEQIMGETVSKAFIIDKKVSRFDQRIIKDKTKDKETIWGDASDLETTDSTLEEWIKPDETSRQEVHSRVPGARKRHQQATQSAMQQDIEDIEDMDADERRQLHLDTPEMKKKRREGRAKARAEREKEKARKEAEEESEGYVIKQGTFLKGKKDRAPTPDDFYRENNAIGFIYNKANDKFIAEKGENHNALLIELEREEKSGYTPYQVLTSSYKTDYVLGRYWMNTISLWSKESEATIDTIVKRLEKETGREVEVVWIPEKNYNRGTDEITGEKKVVKSFEVEKNEIYQSKVDEGYIIRVEGMFGEDVKIRVLYERPPSEDMGSKVKSEVGVSYYTTKDNIKEEYEPFTGGIVEVGDVYISKDKGSILEVKEVGNLEVVVEVLYNREDSKLEGDTTTVPERAILENFEIFVGDVNDVLPVKRIERAGYIIHVGDMIEGDVPDPDVYYLNASSITFIYDKENNTIYFPQTIFEDFEDFNITTMNNSTHSFMLEKLREDGWRNGNPDPDTVASFPHKYDVILGRYNGDDGVISIWGNEDPKYIDKIVEEVYNNIGDKPHTVYMHKENYDRD